MISRPAIYLASTAALDRGEPSQAELSAPLSPDELERYRAFRVEPARKLFLVGHYLTRHVLSQICPAVAPAEWRFTQEARGKPTIDPAMQIADLHFNLSHSGELAAVLVSSSPCGVDIEHARPALDFDQLAEHSFHPDEVRDVARRGRTAFYQYWTLKEAYAKLTGDGLYTPFRRFRVDLEPPMRIIPDAGPAPAPLHLFWRELDDYHLAAALPTSTPPALHWLPALSPTSSS